MKRKAILASSFIPPSRNPILALKISIKPPSEDVNRTVEVVVEVVDGRVGSGSDVSAARVTSRGI
jgi:hypothetical protein